MEILFDGIPLDKVTTSMTINGPAIVLLCFYIALADIRGTSRASHRRHRPERLPEGVHRAARVARSAAAGHARRDRHDRVLQHGRCRASTRVSISGYHIREAGATAAQELAFTLADGIAYVESCLARGLDVDDFAPRLSFFFDVHNDFFEEIAKFRAARRIWARTHEGALRREAAREHEAPHARPDRRRFAHRAAAVQQRGARRAAGARGGARRHAVAAHQLARRDVRSADRRGGHDRPPHAADHRWRRSGVANTIDPLGGQLLRRVAHQQARGRGLASTSSASTTMGGMVAAIEKGYPQREIAASSYQFQRQLEPASGRWSGVNQYVQSDPAKVPTLRIDEEVQKLQCANLAKVKKGARCRASRYVAGRGSRRRAHGEELDAPDHRGRKGLRERAGDLRRPARRLGTYTDPAEF